MAKFNPLETLNKTLWEFVAMALFVYVGTGTACAIGGADGGSVTGISLAFGLAITALVYSSAHESGGHVNCAVTLALMISGDCDIVDGICMIIAQFLGSLAGAGLITATFERDMDRTGSLVTLKNAGANSLGQNVPSQSAWVGEILMTYLLLTVIYKTAIDKRSVARSYEGTNPIAAPLAIGIAVFLAHQVLIPIDGCSINPTRSFGPAMTAYLRHEENDGVFDNFEIFMIAPCTKPRDNSMSANI